MSVIFRTVEAVGPSGRKLSEEILSSYRNIGAECESGIYRAEDAGYVFSVYW